MSTKDIIFINGLTVSTTIGVNTWEREIKQKLVFDIEIYTDIIKSAQSDNIKDTIDYKNLSEAIKEFVAANTFNLIESVADKVANLIIKNTEASKVKLILKKPKAINFVDTVGVCIERNSK